MAELYLTRKIDSYLKKWKKDADRKPLIVKGPRQVGKTESLRRFANANYQSVIYINFVEEPKYKFITDDGYGTDDIIKNISRIDPAKRFEPGNTVIFFDEIQDFPQISTALKFFKIDGRFDVICSGSLLGINYKKIESNSVGYKTDYTMNSLDFEEFLWAKGYQADTIHDMLWHMFECLNKNTTEVRNIKKYLLATLFNAPSTMGSYYKAQVNRDMYAY